ncbi:MAG: META domain-containing protein [Nonlabens sp.]|uniref:META domain-containing protein n=1 Tax=Nonlabens sp. TaxID=1888209 RepID=UPI003EF8CD78
MRLFTILFSLTLFTLTSCDEQDVAGDYDVVMVGENDYSEHDITLTIVMGEENSISGKSACNRYNGTFENLGKGKVKIGPLMGTKMYCKDVAQVENDYMKHLGMVTEVKMTSDGLQLMGSKGKILITAVKQ